MPRAIVSSESGWTRNVMEAAGQESPLAIIRLSRQTSLMDESVKLFQQEQDRLAKAGGAAALIRRQFVDTLIGLVILTLVSILLMSGLSGFPRNSDHSMKVIYYGPVLLSLGTASAIVLRRSASVPRWLRPTLWELIALAVAAVPAGLIDAARLHGG